LHTTPGPVADQLPIHTNIAATIGTLSLAPEGTAIISIDLASPTTDTVQHMGQTGNAEQTSTTVSAAVSAYLTSVDIASNRQPSITPRVMVPPAPEGTVAISINLTSPTTNTVQHMGQTGNAKQTSMTISATMSAYLTCVDITPNRQPSITTATLPPAPEGMATISINLVSPTTDTVQHMGQTGSSKQTSMTISATVPAYPPSAATHANNTLLQPANSSYHLFVDSIKLK